MEKSKNHEICFLCGKEFISELDLISHTLQTHGTCLMPEEIDALKNKKESLISQNPPLDIRKEEKAPIQNSEGGQGTKAQKPKQKPQWRCKWCGMTFKKAKAAMKHVKDQHPDKILEMSEKRKAEGEISQTHPKNLNAQKEPSHKPYITPPLLVHIVSKKKKKNGKVQYIYDEDRYLDDSITVYSPKSKGARNGFEYGLSDW
ncbi:MAG: hypothetical protein LIO65_05130 [Odoribacter sp.]|nr:hypothetical protein [Bacteroidales bacterium]MCC8173771.1 hypothetical protein [Odoribacter sp.]